MKTRGLYLIVLLITSIACNNTKPPSNYQKVEYKVWGTKCIIIHKKSPEVNVLEGVKYIFDSLSQSISTYDSNSLLSRINRDETDSLDPVLSLLLEESRLIHQLSLGSFDPTVQPIVSKWGFLTQEGRWIDTSELPKVMKLVGLEKWSWSNNRITSKPIGAQIDFNAIAPGFAADCIAAYLKKNGVQDFFINNGGEIVLSGFRPDGTAWKVGIVSPAKKDQKQKGDTLYCFTDIALATSGNYYNKFKYNGVEYSHTISPKTGLPIQSDLMSATVIAKNATLADAHATVCMTLNKDEALKYLKQQQLEGYLIYKNKEGYIKRAMIP
jgi:thiamine biosynthesis lipoprotein